MIVTLNLPPVTQYQLDAIFCDERNGIIEATTKAGKTLGCILWLLTTAGAAPKGEGWWVAPIAEQADIAYRRTVGILRGADPEQNHWTTNKTTKSIELPNGVILRFKGSDDPDSLYGEDVFAAVIDEASRCKEEAWHAVRSTLTATRGKVRIIGNVKGRQNWAYRLARRVEGGLTNWRYAKITCYDAVKAGIIPADEVEAARRELPESVFRELYEGIPSEDGSNPFGLSHIAACIMERLSDGEPVCWGVDLAKSEDWTVCIALDRNGQTCRAERWQRVPWAETSRRIIELVGDTPALVDSTGVGDPVVEGLQQRAPQIEGFKFTNASKQQLMEGLAVEIQSRRIGFPDGIIRTELEAFAFEYSPTMKVRYTAPEGMHDDCVCALALAVQKFNHRAAVGVGWSDSPLEASAKAARDAANEDYFFGEA